MKITLKISEKITLAAIAWIFLTMLLAGVIFIYLDNKAQYLSAHEKINESINRFHNGLKDKEVYLLEKLSYLAESDDMYASLTLFEYYLSQNKSCNHSLVMEKQTASQLINKFSRITSLGSIAVFDLNGNLIAASTSDDNKTYTAVYSDDMASSLEFYNEETGDILTNNMFPNFLMNNSFKTYSYEEKILYKYSENVISITVVKPVTKYQTNGKIISLGYVSVTEFLDESFFNDFFNETGIDIKYGAYEDIAIYGLNTSNILHSKKFIKYPDNELAKDKVLKSENSYYAVQLWEPIKNLNTKLVFIKDSSEITGFSNLKETFIFIMILSIFIIAPASILLIDRNISVPLKKLLQQIDSLEKGDFNIQSPINTKDEIGTLFNSFNRMAEKIKDRENKLKLMNEELEQLVDSETEKRRKHEQIVFEQKKFADMGQMINAVAHQWRQPLNIIGLYVQSFVEDMEESKNLEGLKTFENDIFEQLKYMSGTIDNFRNFFMYEKEAKNFEVVFSTIEVLKMVHAQMSSKGIDIIVNCECDKKSVHCTDLNEPPVCGYHRTIVNGYETEFKQAVLNLVQNSQDAIIENLSKNLIEKGFVQINLSGYNNIVTIEIADNGGGIPDEIIHDVFAPYFTTKEEGKGTGVGLFMTKTIIESRMSGSISVSNRNGGAVFTIKLPSVRQSLEIQNG